LFLFEGIFFYYIFIFVWRHILLLYLFEEVDFLNLVCFCLKEYSSIIFLYLLEGIFFYYICLRKWILWIWRVLLLYFYNCLKAYSSIIFVWGSGLYESGVHVWPKPNWSKIISIPFLLWHVRDHILTYECYFHLELFLRWWELKHNRLMVNSYLIFFYTIGIIYFILTYECYLHLKSLWWELKHSRLMVNFYLIFFYGIGYFIFVVISFRDWNLIFK